MNNVVPTLRFMKDTLRHKWFVLLAGLRTKAPLWRLIIHDWSKFTPAEAPHYGRRLHGSKDDNLGYVTAWNHHHKANPHHWEYWIPGSVHKASPVAAGEPLPMPEWAVREMVADWLGAYRTHEGGMPASLDDWPWVRSNHAALRLHVETWKRLRMVLSEVFDDVPSWLGPPAAP